MKNSISMFGIAASEAAVIGKSGEFQNISNVLIHRACDVLLRLLYQLGPAPLHETPEGAYRVFAFELVGEVPYTIRALYILSARGHYPQCVTLVRGLLESFVQLRYFAVHPEALKGHLLATKSKERVKFVTMFDEMAPGSYVTIYGLLSGVAHSGIALSALLPFQPAVGDQPGKALGRHGCQFDEKHAAIVINFTAALTRGFLNQFVTFFPAATPSEALTFERIELAKLLAKVVAGGIKGEMYSVFLQLTDGPTPAAQS